MTAASRQNISLRCNTNCLLIVDKRSDERWCINHGTISSAYKAGDALSCEDSDPYPLIPSDAFIWNAWCYGKFETEQDLAKAIGVSNSYLLKTIKRHSMRMNTTSRPSSYKS